MGKKRADDISKLLRDTERLLQESSRIGKPKKKSFKLPSMPHVPHANVLLYIMLAVLVVILLILFIPLETTTACDTKDCFVEHANKCSPATYEFNVETAQLRITSGSDCSFEKEVLSLDSGEDTSVRQLFQGTNMECTYTKGAFDENYVTMISGNLDPCYGTLADAVRSIT